MKKICFFASLLCLCTSCHVGRFFYWNFADLNDHKKFRYATVKKEGEPFQFTPFTSEKSSFKIPPHVRVKGEKYTFEEGLEKGKSLAFLVIRNDSIIYEYYNKKFAPDQISPSFSASKSFVSALVGIAIAEGFIESVHDPITKYLPELNPKEFGEITIEHVLQMRSGLKFNEGYFNPFGDVAKYYYGKNLRKYASHLKMERAPNEGFNYISLNTQILGIIVENATKKPLYQYLEEKIWKPLGMESDATWSVDSKKNMTVKAFCCLNATARDFAKFGRLYLQKGTWNGQQVVPQDWIERSLDFRGSRKYNYQWWHIPVWEPKPLTDTTQIPPYSRAVEDSTQLGVKRYYPPNNNFEAKGLYGQLICVFPARNLIIVRLGKSAKVNWEQVFWDIVRAND